MEVINHLLGYQNLKIFQNTEMFNFSLDSVILPKFVTLNLRTKKILDIGCGNGVISLILSTKTKAKITAVELQKEVFELAKKTIKENKLEDQITLINDDINKFANKLESDVFDVIVCNPPFFKVKSGSRLNKSKYKLKARHEIDLTLVDILKISRKLLKNEGRVALVHRPERLIEIIELMINNNIAPSKLQFVYPKENKEANMILIEGRKNGKQGLKILPPLIVHNSDNTYTEKIKQYFS